MATATQHAHGEARPKELGLSNAISPAKLSTVDRAATFSTDTVIRRPPVDKVVVFSTDSDLFGLEVRDDQSICLWLFA